MAVSLTQATATPQEPTTPLPSAPPDGLRPDTPKGKKRILLAEDLEDNRDVVMLFLNNSTYDLDPAENGAVALEKFTAGTYDLVLMDMQMPVMDGFTATAAIRAWEREHRRPPIPILALTANAFQEDIDKSLAAGCTAHLTKPIKKKLLLAALDQYLTPPSHKAAA